MNPRSYLFVPGDRPERFEKARTSAAHAAILDLEDAVAPDQKDTARALVAGWLHPDRPVYLRVNGPTTPWHAADLALLARPGIAGVLLPKAEDVEQIDRVAQAYRGDGPVLPILESALGVWKALELASASRVARVIFGSWDFQLDVGIPGEGEALLYARSRLVLASRVAGKLPPADGVTAKLDDDARLRADIEAARLLGFGAKLCIHPKQAAAVNAGFLPPPAEIAWAREIMAAVAASDGAGAIRAGGQMVDRPVIDRARAILAQVGPEADQ